MLFVVLNDPQVIFYIKHFNTLHARVLNIIDACEVIHAFNSFECQHLYGWLWLGWTSYQMQLQLCVCVCLCAVKEYLALFPVLLSIVTNCDAKHFCVVIKLHYSTISLSTISWICSIFPQAFNILVFSFINCTKIFNSHCISTQPQPSTRGMCNKFIQHFTTDSSRWHECTLAIDDTYWQYYLTNKLVLLFFAANLKMSLLQKRNINFLIQFSGSDSNRPQRHFRHCAVLLPSFSSFHVHGIITIILLCCPSFPDVTPAAEEWWRH